MGCRRRATGAVFFEIRMSGGVPTGGDPRKERPGSRPRDGKVEIRPCLVYVPLPLQVSPDPPRSSTQELKKTRRRRSVEEPPSNRALPSARQPQIIFRKRPTTSKLPVDRWMMTFSVVLVLKEEPRRAAVTNGPGDLTRPRGDGTIALTNLFRSRRSGALPLLCCALCLLPGIRSPLCFGCVRC